MHAHGRASPLSLVHAPGPTRLKEAAATAGASLTGVHAPCQWRGSPHAADSSGGGRTTRRAWSRPPLPLCMQPAEAAGGRRQAAGAPAPSAQQRLSARGSIASNLALRALEY